MEKELFRNEIRNHYDNITDEQIEDFLDTEFDCGLSLEENIYWFQTYLQGIFD